MVSPSPSLTISPVRCEADMRRAWLAVMTRSQIGCRGIWAMYLGPRGLPLAPISVVAEIDPLPLSKVVDRIASELRASLGDFPRFTTVSCLLTRPRSSRLGPRDMAWMAELQRGLERWGSLHWPVYSFIGSRVHSLSEKGSGTEIR